MNKAALIMAGGTGTRAGGGIPKQFRNLAGQPIIFHSIRAFLQADPATRIIVVAHPDYIGTFKSLFGLLPLADRFDYEIVAGGATRLESVQAGISKAFGQPVDLIAVHDAARPLVSAEMIAEGWQSASEQKAAVPVVPVVDSLRKKRPTGLHIR